LPNGSGPFPVCGLREDFALPVCGPRLHNVLVISHTATDQASSDELHHPRSTIQMKKINTRKFLIPLATLVAAGAVAVGSGATFSSTTGNTISAVTSGTLTHTNSKNGQAIFNLSNMKPGDTLNGTLTLTNTGSLPAAFSLTEVSSANGFSVDGSNLTLDIVDTTTSTTVYTGTFGGLTDGTKNALGTWAGGAAHSFRFTVKLNNDTPNADQGKTANAVYAWDSVQLAGETFNQ
jgi:spore coat-associated protein N